MHAIQVPSFIAAITAGALRNSEITIDTKTDQVSVPMVQLAHAALGMVPSPKDISFDYLPSEGLEITLYPGIIPWVRDYTSEYAIEGTSFGRIADNCCGLRASVSEDEFWNSLTKGVQYIVPEAVQIRRGPQLLERFVKCWQQHVGF